VHPPPVASIEHGVEAPGAPSPLMEPSIFLAAGGAPGEFPFPYAVSVAHHAFRFLFQTGVHAPDSRSAADDGASQTGRRPAASMA